MKKLQLLIMFFVLILFQNCKNNSFEKEIKQDDVVTINNNNITENKINIDSIIDNYAKHLTNSNIKILDSITCSQYLKNEQGTYGYYSVKSNLNNGKLSGDLNGDGQTDYIANYTCENCYGGNGADNYLSNCFFLTSKGNQILVNEDMTNDFKQKLIDEIKNKFGNPYFINAEKEIMINGIEFTEIKNQVAYGIFNINTDACQGSPFPCVNGTFEYDTKNKTLKMLGKITVEQ